VGSGTSGIAALKQGRSFIGIEKVLAYYEIAKKRLAEAASAGPLFQMAEAGA
jgi:site-specific DNA-methyltransferase (adenine-specific)